MLPRSSWKNFWIVTALAIVAVFAEGIWLAGRDLPPPPGSEPVVLGAGGVTAHHMSTKSWSLSYDHAQTSPDGSIAEIDGIHDGVLFRKGKPYLTIRARHVSANTVSDDFTAVGDVHVAQLAGTMPRSFDTDLIVWTNAAKTLTLSHPSLIKTGRNALTVESITINIQTGAVKIGKIRGTVHV